MKIPRLALAYSFMAATTAVVNAALVEYDWTITPRRSRPPLSPDCFIERDMLLVNDLNPGPEIRANVGDTIKVTWHNHSPSEGVTIHYHGLTMQDQPYADGTATVSACNVGPMQTFVQEFVADNAGTHYWHGHTSLDRLDGLQGAIIIVDPNDPDEQALQELYDEERVIFLQDWYHRPGPGIRTGKDQSVPIFTYRRIIVCFDTSSLTPSCAILSLRTRFRTVHLVGKRPKLSH